MGLAACGSPAVDVPAPYQNASPPAADFLINPTNLAAGATLYHRHCATCHGQAGHGDGPAGHTLSLKPANLTDPHLTQQPLNYWFWRISEGGTVEPFHSRGSIMPAWKYFLSETERWQVIAFSRSLATIQK